MNSIKQRSYQIVSAISLFVFFAGCATVAHRPYACEAMSDPRARMGSSLFQVGECAPFGDFYIETGDYYGFRRDNLDFEVKVYRRQNDIVSSSLEHFAKSFNCPKEAYQQFADLLKFHQDEIFGANFENGPRKVSLNIIQGIRRDPYLNFFCTRDNIMKQIEKYGWDKPY